MSPTPSLASVPVTCAIGAFEDGPVPGLASTLVASVIQVTHASVASGVWSPSAEPATRPQPGVPSDPRLPPLTRSVRGSLLVLKNVSW